jgi:hypothetical protein
MQGRRKIKDGNDFFTVAELISTMTNLIPPLCKNLEDIIEYFQVKRKLLSILHHAHIIISTNIYIHTHTL